MSRNKPTTQNYVKFLYTALGSASELRYLVRVAADLALWDAEAKQRLPKDCERVVKKLEKLIQSMEWRLAGEKEVRVLDRSRKSGDGSPR